MRTWFCDKRMERNIDNPQLVSVERLYFINEIDFTQQDYHKLDEIMLSLPEYLRRGADGCPYWFGVDEENPPYLWASMEAPFGLQVVGTLMEEDWLAWDAAFREQAQHLPHYEVEAEDAAF
jgi:hypothetical protein